MNNSSKREFSDLSKIKILVLDIDGVCTDGLLHYNAHGEVSKVFNTQDGIGIKTAMQTGLEIGIITGRDDPAVAARVADLHIKHYYYGECAKLKYLEEIRSKLALNYSEMAYLGDDWIDIDPMRKVGYPMAVANAREELFAEAAYTTKRVGGQAAVREAIEHILSARFTKAEMMQFWIAKE